MVALTINKVNVYISKYFSFDSVKMYEIGF